MDTLRASTQNQMGNLTASYHGFVNMILQFSVNVKCAYIPSTDKFSVYMRGVSYRQSLSWSNFRYGTVLLARVFDYQMNHTGFLF